MTTLLSIENLGKSFGGFKALSGLNFEVAQGETFAIIGPNGAGKTTLFKVLTGEIPATTGKIDFDGTDITRFAADERVRMGIGRTFQIVRIMPEFTLMENLIVAIEVRQKTLKGQSWRRRVSPDPSVVEEAYHRLEQVHLENSHATEARHLSLGDRKRLELIATLALEPVVLLLDEPTAGMSPPERVAIIDLIHRKKEELGLTILLTEHDMDFVFRLSQRLMVMNQGQKIIDGLPAEIAASETVREIYLGKETVNA